jgi:hypothetical protein
MRPCDCQDIHSAEQLNEQGISYNGNSITIAPPAVILKIDSCELRIPMCLFKRFAEWYLEEQEIEWKAYHQYL